MPLCLSKFLSRTCLLLANVPVFLPSLRALLSSCLRRFFLLYLSAVLVHESCTVEAVATNSATTPSSYRQWLCCERSSRWMCEYTYRVEFIMSRSSLARIRILARITCVQQQELQGLSTKPCASVLCSGSRVQVYRYTLSHAFEVHHARVNRCL